MESMEHPITVIHHVKAMLNKFVVDLEPTMSMMFHKREIYRDFKVSKESDLKIKLRSLFLF